VQRTQVRANDTLTTAVNHTTERDRASKKGERHWGRPKRKEMQGASVTSDSFPLPHGGQVKKERTVKSYPPERVTTPGGKRRMVT